MHKVQPSRAESGFANQPASQNNSFPQEIEGLSLILLLIGFNVLFAFLALSMAGKRSLNKTAAFWAGFFGSFLTLLIIGMFPKE